MLDIKNIYKTHTHTHYYSNLVKLKRFLNIYTLKMGLDIGDLIPLGAW